MRSPEKEIKWIETGSEENVSLFTRTVSYIDYLKESIRKSSTTK